MGNTDGSRSAESGRKPLFVGLLSLLVLGGIVLGWLFFHPGDTVSPPPAETAAEESGVSGWERAEVEARFFHKTERRRDDVNHLAMLKPAYDGIVLAGLLPDDDREHLRTTGATFAVDPAAPRVELHFTREG